MRAFQVVGFGAPLAFRALAVPLPEAREVVVDVASCGLCHLDAHFRQGHISLSGDQNLPVAMLGIQTPVTPGKSTGTAPMSASRSSIAFVARCCITWDGPTS